MTLGIPEGSLIQLNPWNPSLPSSSCRNAEVSEIHLRLGSGVKEDSHRCLLCPAKGKPWGQTALFVRLNSHGDSDVLNLAIYGFHRVS